MKVKETKTVLFYGINTPGHRNTLMAIADMLKADHGYKTVFLTLGPTWDKSIENHGHEMIMLEEASSIEEYEIDEADGCKQKVKLSGFYKFEHLLRRVWGSFAPDPVSQWIDGCNSFLPMWLSEVRDNHENLANAIKKIDPDLVIVDVGGMPPSILKLKNIPWIRVFSVNPLSVTEPNPALGVKPPSFCGFKLLDKERRTRMRKEKPEEWDAMIESWRSATERIEELTDTDIVAALNKFYLDQGCPEIPKRHWGHYSPYLNLYLSPKEIDYDQDDDLFYYPANFFRCDSHMRKTEAPKFWVEKLSEAMKGKKEMIFFSLGSLASGNYKLIQKYIDIFRKDQDRLYVISKGPNGDKFELDPNNMIGGNYIPQTFFLERADLAIIHGGNNSIYECLYFGIPMIVLPVFGDQLDNAQRIEDLRLGRRLDVYQCIEKQMFEAVDRVMSDDSIRQKVRTIGEKVRARDTSAKISRMLKKLLDEKDMSQSFIDECRVKDVDEIQF